MLIKSPQPLLDVAAENVFRVFLAGSIEMGKAPHWQALLEQEFATCKDVLLYNPRRDDWDNSWREEAGDARFSEQVSWELEAMERADLIIMYFAPVTQSPVTLLELGLYARSGKLVVCCPEGFWRKGNVDMVCSRYKVHQVGTVAQLTDFIHQVKHKKLC